MTCMKYHIWTIGCQMNVADSQRVASTLERLGYQSTHRAEDADVIVLNTCVVRQSAEDKATGHLNSLRPLKKRNPKLVINLMGCMVSPHNTAKLQSLFPFVDVFSPPVDPSPLVSYLTQAESHSLDEAETRQRFDIMDGELILPAHERGRLASTNVPIINGCSHACTYCVIPYRRGPERSRPAEEILREVHSLVAQGVKEITLLGQIVDRYGKDLPEGSSLVGLLRHLQEVEGLERIRFLTSHPNWMTDELLQTAAELPKVMPHIEVPVQAGDDQVLADMRRGYTADDYRRLIERIRTFIPDVAIANDIIVGFPGESDEQFQHTYDLLAELKLDVVHLARYSTRPGTVAARKMLDDVPEAEKWRRFRLIEELQEQIATEINARYLGKTVEVLFECQVKGRWKGRTPTNKLVFVEAASAESLAEEPNQDFHGRVLPVAITWSGPWSMQGRFVLNPHPPPPSSNHWRRRVAPNGKQR